MQDPLFGNKLAAAILIALLLFFGLPQLANALFGGGHHGGGHGDELHLAYPIDFQVEGAGAQEAEKGPSFAELMAAATPAGGARRAALCKSCHTFDKGGAQGTGPNLWDVVGRGVASVDGFRYSSALTGAGGDWTYERLDAYLQNSQAYVPGTAMVQRVGKAEHRADIIAYLRSLSDAPPPLPAVAAGE